MIFGWPRYVSPNFGGSLPAHLCELCPHPMYVMRTLRGPRFNPKIKKRRKLFDRSVADVPVFV